MTFLSYKYICIFLPKTTSQQADKLSGGIHPFYSVSENAITAGIVSAMKANYLSLQKMVVVTVTYTKNLKTSDNK